MLFTRPFTGRSRSVAVRSARAAKSNFETLESRTLLSVSLGSDGFSNIVKSSDSKVIYVSSSSGSDSNSGLSSNSPVKSVAKGVSLMRSGMPDEVLLKRGDSWTENLSWNKSGRSSQEPALLGAYGSGARPMIKAGSGNALEIASGNVDYLAIQGVHFFAHTRDPNISGFSRTGGGYGMRFVAGTKGVLIEDTVFDQFRFNLLFQEFNSSQNNVTIRRSVITDAYSTGGHSSGIYAEGVSGLTLEENVFDHNGWNNQVSGGGATAQNHNVYLTAATDNVVVKGNVFANASSHGLQARSGGDIRDNLFLRNPIHLSYGLVNGSPLKAGGVTGTVDGNVFMESALIGGSVRGWALELGNIKSATVSNNIFSDDTVGEAAAISLGVGKDLTNSGSGVGINNLVISNNVVNKWYRSLEFSGGLDVGGSGNSGLNNLTVRNNDFQNSTGPYSRLVWHSGEIDRNEETWSSNRYYDDGDPSQWFVVGNTNTSLSLWQAKIEPTAQGVKVNYSNPNASISSYAGSAASFLNKVRSQSSGNWSGGPARGAVNYIRGAFNKGASTSPLPTPSPTQTPSPTPTPSPTGTTTLSINDVSRNEGNSGTSPLTFTITRSGSTSGSSSVKWSTMNKTAGEGDYQAASGTVSFGPSETSKPVTVSIKGDTKIEDNEVFRVNLSSASGAVIADNEGEGTIVNDDGGVTPTQTPTVTPTPSPTPSPTGTTTLSINDVSRTEGNSGTSPLTFTITRSGSTSGSSSVKWSTQNKTAGEGDYQVASGTVSFGPGETSKPVTVSIKGDTKIEDNEVFRVNLSSASGAVIADNQGEGTIVNDDGGSAPTPTLSSTSSADFDRTNPVLLSKSANSTSVTMKFSEDVSASLSGGDLWIKHASTGESVSGMKVSYNRSTNEATWTWSYNGGRLKSGTWDVRLPDQNVTDAAGNRLGGGSDIVFTITV